MGVHHLQTTLLPDLWSVPFTDYPGLPLFLLSSGNKLERSIFSHCFTEVKYGEGLPEGHVASCYWCGLTCKKCFFHLSAMPFSLENSSMPSPSVAETLQVGLCVLRGHQTGEQQGGCWVVIPKGISTFFGEKSPGSDIHFLKDGVTDLVFCRQGANRRGGLKCGRPLAFESSMLCSWFILGKLHHNFGSPFVSSSVSHPLPSSSLLIFFFAHCFSS